MKVRINEEEIPLPQSWNELSLEQCLYIYGILMTDSRDLLEAHELLPVKRMLIVQKLLNLDMKFMEQWESDCIQANGKDDGKLIFHSELDEVLHTIDFLFDRLPNEEDSDITRYQINLGLTRCPYGELSFEKKGGKKKFWYAPHESLENISIYEMGTTFTLFEAFMKTKDEAQADELIATLYRPSKPPNKENKQSAYQGDRRLPLLHHEGMVKKRINRVKLLPKPVKQIIIFWFASCRHKIISDFPNVFKGGGEQRGGNNYGWGGVLLGLADGLVNLDAISSQNHNNALTYLSYLEDKRKEQERRRLAQKIGV